MAKPLIYVAKFAKRGLPHKSILPNLTIRNFWSAQAYDLKVGQQKALT